VGGSISKHTRCILARYSLQSICIPSVPLHGAADVRTCSGEPWSAYGAAAAQGARRRQRRQAQDAVRCGGARPVRRGGTRRRRPKYPARPVKCGAPPCQARRMALGSQAVARPCAGPDAAAGEAATSCVCLAEP
jgi:hypothetical protein